MKNKGFTLIELLVVIVLLSVVTAIAVPITISTINTSKEKAYENQKKVIEDAAKRWVADNPDVAEEEERKVNTESSENIFRVYIEELQNEGYLNTSKEIVNPKTKESMQGCIIITEDTEYNQYTYEYLEQTDEQCIQD